MPKATEAELRVRAVGLNFRDVLNVMGASENLLGSGPFWVILEKEAADFWIFLVFGRDSYGVCMPPLLLLLAGGGLSLGYRLQFVVSFWSLFSFPFTADCSVSR